MDRKKFLDKWGEIGRDSRKECETDLDELLKAEVGFDIKEYAKEITNTCRRVYGEQSGYRNLLGCMEELGELAHAHLKGEQGFKYTEGEVFKKKCDSVGDIVIFLINYCSSEAINFVGCLEGVNQIMKERLVNKQEEPNGDYFLMDTSGNTLVEDALHSMAWVNIENNPHLKRRVKYFSEEEMLKQKRAFEKIAVIVRVYKKGIEK